MLKHQIKYFNTFDYNKFRSDILDTKIKLKKKKKIVSKSNTSNLVNNFDLNKKLAILAIKSELKAEQDKMVKLQTYHLSYLLVITFFVMMVFKICLLIIQNLLRQS